MIGSQGRSPSVLENVVFGFVRAAAASVEIILHRRFGMRYLQVFGSGGCLMICAFAFFVPVRELGPLLVYLFIYMLAGLLATIGAQIRFWRADSEHSFYNGFPKMLSGRSAHWEYLVKQIVEPLVVVAIGTFVWHWSQPLSVYLFCASFCLFVTNHEQRVAATREAIMLHDAMLEQQQRAKRFREIQGSQ